jgi:CheY-like chemotaxis protein
VTAADPEDLPPITILIVEDRARAADQLAQLLLLWGAAAAHPLPRLDDLAAYFSQHPEEPALVLVDHALHRQTGLEIALWIAARPTLRRRVRVAAYTNADELELQQSLRGLLGRLRDDEILAERLLGSSGAPERVTVERYLDEAQMSEVGFDALYRRLYDAYLSKRLSMLAVNRALLALGQTLVDTKG